MAFINEYHIGEMHFLLLSHPFQCFRLVPLVKRQLSLAFLDRTVAISCNTLLHFARDNFDILQTLKFCLVEASWVFTTCPLKYLDWRSFNFL